ncbi:hypothetical protein AQ876_26980 [Burkholderia pseudomallei]|nr:hypothetical protein AQ876_26980 [Burkholderia pseudomallei]ONB89268.1 hypothetical protein AQ906_12080 [Burkholderia pseudomallei]
MHGKGRRRCDATDVTLVMIENPPSILATVRADNPGDIATTVAPLVGDAMAQWIGAPSHS